MCRALLYLGEPVLLDNLLFQPDSALVRQAYMPKMLNRRLRAGARARGGLFHGSRDLAAERASVPVRRAAVGPGPQRRPRTGTDARSAARSRLDRKSTRRNSSHITISYAVFCL